MTRSKRLQPVQRHNDAQVRESARLLAHENEELQRQADSLRQLMDYRDEYGRDFSLHGESAQGVAWLRNYQIFLAQLNRGIEQQQAAVDSCRERVSAAQRAWELARQKSKALDKAVDRLQRDELRDDERREQRLADERNLQRPRGD